MQPPPYRSVAFHLVSPDPEPGVRLIRVEGGLATDDSPRLRGLLSGAMDGDGVPTEAIIVDLRGCTFMAAVCLREMIGASETLTGRGGAGVALVTDETSSLSRRIWVTGGGTLPTFGSSTRALLSIRDGARAE